MKVAFTVLPLLVAAASASCIHGTSLYRRSADGNVDINSFNYTATGGPLNWYGMDKKNSACATGNRQSPIVIDTDVIEYAKKGSVKFNVPNADGVKFENLGSGLEVVLTKGTLDTADASYKLAQFHFHTPSEHRVNEEYYPMECHFVFEDSAGSIAVLVFFFELSQFGYSTPLFDDVLAHIDDISEPGTYTKTGPLDFSGITKHLNCHDIFQYSGSLTTPPCTEPVAWYFSAEPLPLNVQSFNAVKKTLKFNARYTQNTLGQDNLLEIAARDLN